MKLLASAGLIAFLAAPLSAQRAQPQVTVLGNPDRVFPVGFTRIAGFLELPDGRVLVSDRGEEQLVVADFTAGRATPIGRKGSGPAEYRLPSRLIPWLGDSVLLNDQGNTRLAVIGPDLKIHRTFVLNIPNVPTTLAPRAVDARGRMYVQIPRWAAESYGQKGDSAPVVRISPPSSGESGGRRVEVLTLVLLTADPGPVKYGLPYIPFTPQDGWVATPDGNLVLVRSNDYHLEQRDERGTVTRRPGIPTARIAVTREDKVDYTRSFLQGSTMGGRGGPNTAPSGESNMPADWLTDEQVNQLVEQNKFASVKAPITDAAPILAPTGEVWVERSMPHGAASEWDVFNRSGVRVKTIRLPPARRLVSVGRNSVYVIVVDEDGFERVERYRR
jgi:hypothetical protein